MSHAEDHDGDRRDFLYYATGGAGVVVAGAAVWPLVNQMNPSADVRAMSSIRVDISDVAEGSQLTVKWLGKPVFIRHRDETVENAAGRMDPANHVMRQFDARHLTCAQRRRQFCNRLVVHV